MNPRSGCLYGPHAAPSVDEVYRHFLGADVYSAAARALLHTQYHPVHHTLTTQGFVSPAVNNW